jgi:hypothetical protein
MAHVDSDYHGKIYQLVSPPFSIEENSPLYGQLHIFDSEVTTKQLGKQ